MPARPKLRDSRLIDAMEALPQAPFQGKVWRVVREGRDPRQCSAAGGRWDDGTFDVLYTSMERDGALAEMYFHLLRGQPVFPSKVRYTLHELSVSLAAILRFADLTALAALGVDTARYGQLSYAGRVQEYPRTQEVGEVAHFLDCDGITIPSARWTCGNIVVFCGRADPGAVQLVADHGLIDWAQWRKLSQVTF